MTENTEPTPTTAPAPNVAAVDPGAAHADPAEGGLAVPGEPVDPASALEELSNRYTRLAADFDNVRKRTAREHADRSRYAAEAAARALLPVLDNLRRAVDAAPADTAAGLLEGLHHTVRQFEEALASVGVTPIEAVGQPFDPAQHEAVLGEESSAVDVDTVVQELQRGYRLHDKVLRPTMVKVAHPAKAPPARPRKAPHGPDGAGDWIEA